MQCSKNNKTGKTQKPATRAAQSKVVSQACEKGNMKVEHEVKTIALTGVMAALYIVLTLFVNIPLADRISLDLGYAVLGLLVGVLPWWSLAFIGGVGCIVKAVSLTGMFPFAWFPANILLGILLALFCNRKSKAMKILLSVAVVFVCIGGVKTAISFILYGIAGGQAVVIPDLIAAAADSIMLVVGILLSGTVVKVVRRAEK